MLLFSLDIAGELNFGGAQPFKPSPHGAPRTSERHPFPVIEEAAIKSPEKSPAAFRSLSFSLGARFLGTADAPQMIENEEHDFEDTTSMHRCLRGGCTDGFALLKLHGGGFAK